jgi:DNA-directed RNA polymerase subunit L
MEIKILKVSKNEVELEVKGESHTLLNLLQKTLLEDKNVELAGYKVIHRLLETANFYIKTGKNKTAFEALFEAIDKIRKESLDFKQTFEKAVKSFEREKK